MTKRMNPKYEPKTLQAKLGYLVGECGEVMAATGKSIRWGLDSYNPEVPRMPKDTNQDWLLRELDDLERAIKYVRDALATEPTPEPGEPTLRHAGTEHCNSCGGSGSSPASGDCSACDGTGRRPVTSGVPAETAGEDWGRNCAACGAQWVTGSTINKLSDLVEPYQLKVRELQSALTRAEATLAAREQEGAEARAIKDRLLGSPCRLCDDLEVVQTDQGPALCLCSPKRRAQPPLASSVVADEATTGEGAPAPMHPDGRCTCAGEGRCHWCNTHCWGCGARHGVCESDPYSNCPRHYAPAEKRPEAQIDEPSPLTGEEGKAERVDYVTRAELVAALRSVAPPVDNAFDRLAIRLESRAAKGGSDGW